MNTSTRNLTKPLLLVSLLSASLLAGCNSDNDAMKSVNQAPVADDIMLTTVTETAVMGQVKATDSDNDPLMFTLKQQPTLGMVSLQANGEFIYTPANEVTGMDSFTITVTDSVNAPVNVMVSVAIDAQQLQFSSLSREAFLQNANDKPLRINGREIENDVSGINFYDDLLLDQ
ncbi:Ig-like domain-containing protein [Shewanella sp. OMA3-2]|uniref:Ig-like domain-containing protein n=1 Tax=Shewanella sp. OMA3-2 TaxID=2908650 RepID=UPI001F48688F|nr:Ig-like domain-containing protein [Shewanella sp. OMA3-2]UJF23215.1 Ig-like domain-containing protein [Shewanella sp. OMA3-2]